MDKKKRIASVAFVALTLGMLAVFAVLNLQLLSAPVQSLVKREIGGTEFIEKVQKAYPEKLAGKKYLIDLNGLYGRVMGRRVYNKVVLLKNGMLSGIVGRQDEGQIESVLKEFNNYLEGKGIPFLYIQAPAKVDLAGELFPDGVETSQNVNADELLSLLKKDHVNTLDLRPMLAAGQKEIEAYFYRTDHHWTPTGALTALKPITEEMEKVLGTDLDLTYTDPVLWEKHTVPDWFLGSWGKRVGTLFAGVDDLIYYTPKFETAMSCAVPKYSTLFKGDFIKANIREKYINGKDYYGDSAYCVYIGGDYPLVQHRNPNAPNDMRVLLIKDSFMLPEQSFLSAIFSEVDVVDPRHFSQCTVAEYVDIFRPDIVIVLTNPSMGYKKYYAKLDPKVAEERNNYQWSEQPIVVPGTVEIPPKDDDKNAGIITSTPKLERGKRYMLSFEDVQFTRGSADGVAVSLYDATKKAVLYSGVFDVAYCRDHGGFSWTFDVPEQEGHELQLIAYAGIPGETNDVGVIYQDVTLHVLEEAGWG